MTTIETLFAGSKLIPIVTINNIEDAIPLADALEKAGAHVIEVTLRTPIALKVIKLLADRGKLVIGAGTVLSPEQYQDAIKAGARFIVSPGSNYTLMMEAKRHPDIPYMPGISTTSDIMLAREHGFHYLKFFPAEAAGGINMIKNFAPLFGDIKFCPTGGITHTNFKKYLDMPNVFAIGGSWLASSELVRDKRWDDITKHAKTSIITTRVTNL